MKWVLDAPKRGDIIRIDLGNRLYHYGIYVSDDEVIQFGLPPISERHKAPDEIEVIASDIDSFFCDRFLEVAKLDKDEQKRAKKPDDIVEFAKSKIGTKGYHILYNNCEHFVNECVFGVRECKIVEDVRAVWKKMLVVNVYVAEIPQKLNSMDIYPESRAEEIMACGNERVKAEKSFGWKLLEFAVKDSFDVDIRKTDIHKEKSGKWVCSDCFFSLTHSDKYVAVAVSKMPVGIDMEIITGADRHKELDRIMTAEERQICPSYASEEKFLTLWTAKESIFKRRGDEKFLPGGINTVHEKLKTFRNDREKAILTVATDLNEIRIFTVSGEDHSLKKNSEFSALE